MAVAFAQVVPPPAFVFGAIGADTVHLETASDRIDRVVPFAPLTPEALRVVVEHARKDPAPPIAGLELRSTRLYGTTAVSYYVRGPQPA